MLASFRGFHFRGAVRSCASWPARPRVPWLAGRVEAEQSYSAVFAKREAIQTQTPNSHIAANKDCRFLPSVTLGNRNRSVQLGHFTKSSFCIVILRGFAHQSRIDDEQISAPVVLEQFNCSLNHIGKTRLLASLLDLVGECEIFIGESAKKFRTPPDWNRLQFCFGADDVEAVVTQLKQ